MIFCFSPEDMTSNQPADSNPPSLEPGQGSELPDPGQNPKLQKVQNTLGKIVTFKGWPWLITIVVSWVTGATALQWLSSLPPSPNCKQIAATLSEAEQLECADQLARKGNVKDVKAALAIADKWDAEHPLYPRVSLLSDEWSRSMLGLARQEIAKGNLKEAISLAKEVPAASSIQPESKRLIKRWEANWELGEESLENARKAIKKQDWTQAALQVRSLVQLGDGYWQDQADKILGDMAIEKKAFQDLYKAQDIAAYGRAKDLSEAIQLASKIDPKRLAKEEVQKNIEKWSQKLLDLSEEHQEYGQFEKAIAAAQRIPPNTKAAKNATTLVQLSRAEATVEEDDFYSYIHAWTLAEQIDRKSDLFEKNRDRVDAWEQKIQNTGQLHLAKFFANVDNVHTYQLAMDHAALIDTEKPGRIQAQTLIAQWNQQINTFQDRQVLARARQFATQKTTAGFQAAILEARKVEFGNPLRDEAQTLMQEWEGSIEKVEDQPILDEARRLAKAGKLNDAIKTAEQIESGRSLHREAQDDIYAWVADIQSVEDRPILNEANALARNGRLSDAIATASQIGYGRALYYDAQDKIAAWAAERDAIYASRRRREEPRYEPEPRYDPELRYDPEPAPVQRQAPPSAPPPAETYAPDPDGELSRPVILDPTAEE